MNLLKLALTTFLALVSLDYSERVDEIIPMIDASLEGGERVFI